MEEKINEILKKLDNCLDEAECYYKELEQIGTNGDYNWRITELARSLRVQSQLAVDFSIYELRKDTQRIKKELDMYDP